METSYTNRTVRSAMVLGQDGMDRITGAKVLVFGVGGVGSWCAEALVRTGIGHIAIVDCDTVAESNINRQLMATTRTVGRPKVEVLKERLLEINPDLDILVYDMRVSPENLDVFHIEDYDAVVDAIDSVADKAALILRTTGLGIPLFSSMGAAMKKDPSRIRVDEFRKVEQDPLASALRKRFKKDGNWPGKFRCVHSMEPSIRRELPKDAGISEDDPVREGGFRKRPVGGSLIAITGCFGFHLASLVIEEITQG